MKLTILLATVALLCGCAGFTSFVTTDAQAINQGITFGAKAYISAAGGTVTPPSLYSPQQQARAQSLENAAIEIQGFATGTVSLAQLDATLDKWQLSLKTPLDQDAAGALIAAINVELSTRITSGVIGAAASVAVTDLTNDFIAAAKVYGAT